jgi:hypothetical protein
MKPSLYLRNKSASVDFTIADLGIILLKGSPGPARHLTAEYSFDELASSDDLDTLIDSDFANLEASSDGTTWLLTSQDVKDILSTFNLKQHGDIDSGNPHSVTPSDLDPDAIITRANQALTAQLSESRLNISGHKSSGDHDGRYYTESELDAFFAGEALGKKQIDWDNVLNKPNVGTEGQYDPVNFRVLGIVGVNGYTTPAGGSLNDVYIDALRNVMIHNGTSFVDSSLDITDSQDVINLNASGAIYTYTTADGWVATIPTPESGFEITVINNGDGKQEGYVFDSTSGTWKFRYRVDTPAIKTLDDAYNDGHVIEVDAGAVDFNNTNAHAPFHFNVKAAAPTTTPAVGKTGITYVGGMPYFYDNIRSKWLSVEKTIIVFATGNNTKSRYMDLNGLIPSLKSGMRLPRNMTLTEIIVDADNTHSATYSVRTKDAIGTDIASLEIASASGGWTLTESVDIVSGKVPIVYIDVPGVGVNYPVCQLVFRNRL